MLWYKGIENFIRIPSIMAWSKLSVSLAQSIYQILLESTASISFSHFMFGKLNWAHLASLSRKRIFFVLFILLCGIPFLHLKQGRVLW